MRRIFLICLLLSISFISPSFANLFGIGDGSSTAQAEKGLPKTGQITSYADYDDGYYHKGLPSSGDHFTDNGDGTITDNATGLMWVQDGNGVGCNNGTGATWTDAINFCDALDFAGHTDWRLPNIRELLSIIDHGEGWPAINPLFTNTPTSNHWSSTTYALWTPYVWYVYVGDGSSAYGNAGNLYYVRPVRDGS